MKTFSSDYECFLNSADSFDYELPLKKRKATGGTMALWKHSLDPYVKICPCPTSSVLPFLFSPPGLSRSLHILLYLPTAGKDEEYIIEFAKLMQCLDELTNTYPDA